MRRTPRSLAILATSLLVSMSLVGCSSLSAVGAESTGAAASASSGATTEESNADSTTEASESTTTSDDETRADAASTSEPSGEETRAAAEPAQSPAASPSQAEPGLIETIAPSPGSTWKPPPPHPEDAEEVRLYASHGIAMAYQDPASYPDPAAAVGSPKMPPEGFENTPLAAGLIARYYFEAFTYYVSTGDYSAISPATATTCDSCNYLTELYRASFKKEGVYGAIGPVTTSDAAIRPRDDGAYTVTIVTRLDAAKVYWPSEQLVFTTQPFTGTWDLVVGWSDEGNFIVYDVRMREPKDETSAPS